MFFPFDRSAMRFSQMGCKNREIVHSRQTEIAINLIFNGLKFSQGPSRLHFSEKIFFIFFYLVHTQTQSPVFTPRNRQSNPRKMLPFIHLQVPGRSPSSNPAVDLFHTPLATKPPPPPFLRESFRFPLGIPQYFPKKYRSSCEGFLKRSRR